MKAGHLLYGNQTAVVREYVREKYIRPALRARQRTVRVVVGDVHRELTLAKRIPPNRVPVVCQALTSGKFLAENGLHIVERTGPPSGQSTTVAITYELKSDAKASRLDSWLALRGAGKETFAALGGGEAFLTAERASWSKLDKA